VRRVRDREQRVAYRAQLDRERGTVAVAERRVVRLHGELAHALQIADGRSERLLLEPELVTRELRVRAELIEPRQRRVERGDACRRDGVVGRRVDALARRDLILRLDDAPLRLL